MQVGDSKSQRWCTAEQTLDSAKPDQLQPPLAQEYDYHLAAVNTITFVDEGRRFVSTSDDKTIRVWDLGVPVQVRRPACLL